jgi:hypothetical protein
VPFNSLFYFLMSLSGVYSALVEVQKRVVFVTHKCGPGVWQILHKHILTLSSPEALFFKVRKHMIIHFGNLELKYLPQHPVYFLTPEKYGRLRLRTPLSIN